jgi:monofunctional biosynthetic peptidoglycan transglycosylase
MLMLRPALTAAGLFVLMSSPLSSQESRINKIIDTRSAGSGDWFIVNDGVMGGRSYSALENGDEGQAVFEGYLSLENNGGFASVRTGVPDSALAGASSVFLRVRGDGKRYQLRLRPRGRSREVAFAAGFDTTAGRWKTVELPLDSFEPTFRGYRPPGVGPLDPSQVVQVGIMITDKQEGPFRLEIDWIGVGARQ